MKVDDKGRITLPKRLRDRLGLVPGTELEIEETAERVTIRPATQSPSIVRKNGFLVHLGKLPPSIDEKSLIDAVREERIRELFRSGL